MIVSTKGRYGLRLLLEVALHQHQGPVTLSDVATRQGISQPYLWQVVNPLKSAGILHVRRGAHGGYVLARDPSKITIRDIVDILEGATSFVVGQHDPKEEQNFVSSTAHETWVEIEKQITEVLSKITLQDMINRLREMESGGSPNYVI